MLTQGESEGLQTLGIVVVLCSSLKLLHYLGLIDLSDGKRAPRASPFYTNVFSGLDCCESISGGGGKVRGKWHRSPGRLGGVACTNLPPCPLGVVRGTELCRASGAHVGPGVFFFLLRERSKVHTTSPFSRKVSDKYAYFGRS